MVLPISLGRRLVIVQQASIGEQDRARADGANRSTLIVLPHQPFDRRWPAPARTEFGGKLQIGYQHNVGRWCVGKGARGGNRNAKGTGKRLAVFRDDGNVEHGPGPHHFPSMPAR